MKFTILTAALALFSGLVASAPVAEAEADVQLETRQKATLYPNFGQLIYSPSWGATTNYVTINRHTWNGVQYDTNTLLNYHFTQGYPGKKCRFVLGSGYYAGGTRKVQLFSVGGPITADNTFTSRPYRNIHYGIFTIAPDGASATWDAIPPPTFDCPSSPGNFGYEVVPQGDECWAGWTLETGLGIEVLS